MEWAERLKHVSVIDAALRAIGLPRRVIRRMEHSLYVFMKNYTSGHAKAMIKNGVLNGFDAWRKLVKDQMPLAEDMRNILI